MNVQPLDLNTRVQQYVSLRDKIKEIRSRHKEELKPFVETLEKLNSIILNLLDQAGTESARTKNGTAYKTLKHSATIADKSAFWDFIYANKQWDLMDYKANAPAVNDFIVKLKEAAKNDPNIIPAPPPGVNYSEYWEVGVRRK